jgi:endonuclease/exonuclease/phosphatase family metal-dependent hydrolase
MRRAILLILLLWTAALPAAESSGTFTVMSLNVRYPSSGDGPNIWEQRRNLLVETVRTVSPDIIGTQELFFTQGEYIVTALPEYKWFGLSRYGNRENEHMGVFYRKSKLKLLDSGSFWLSATPEVPGSMSWGTDLPRMVTWGQFERSSDGFRFYFFNTHFPHRAADAQARENCARLLADRLRQLPLNTPAILTGDFNTDAETPPYRLLAQEMQDAWKNAPSKSGPEGTFHGFKGIPGSSRIDWILYRGPWKVLEAVVIDRHDGDRYPSDHFPVAAVFLAGAASGIKDR